MSNHLKTGAISDVSGGSYVLHMECYGWPHALPMRVEGDAVAFVGVGRRWAMPLTVSHKVGNEQCSNYSVFVFGVCCSQHLNACSCIWYQVPDTRYMISDFMCLARGTRYMLSCIRTFSRKVSTPVRTSWTPVCVM
jgi:hypothetical protein